MALDQLTLPGQVLAVTVANESTEAKSASTEITEIWAEERVDSQQEEQWSPMSWTSKPPSPQSVDYANPEQLYDALQVIRCQQALMDRFAIDQACKDVQRVASGDGFIFQAGDCAENFVDVKLENVRARCNLIALQSQVLSNALGKRVVTIGRLAGQYAKPRSSPFETCPTTGQVMHAFRGHNINSDKGQPADRQPDPSRLVLGHLYATATLRIMDAWQSEASQLGLQRLYTSHEAFHLPLESAVTDNLGYNSSASMLWIGERTRQLDGPHIEYIRGLRNPIGVKIGPTTTASDLIALLDVLSPPQRKDCPRGRPVVSLITRIGKGKVQSVLPNLIRAARQAGHQPIWICDPCHGNTVKLADGSKTRYIVDMLDEMQETYVVHQQCGNALGGIHIEQAGETDIMECFEDTTESALVGKTAKYASLCDPRLSYAQALSVVERFADFVVRYEGVQQGKDMKFSAL